MNFYKFYILLLSFLLLSCSATEEASTESADTTSSTTSITIESQDNQGDDDFDYDIAIENFENYWETLLKEGNPLTFEELALTYNLNELMNENFDWDEERQKSHINPEKIENEIKLIDKMTLRINDILIGLFRGIGIKLIDFKLEFGRIWNNDQKEVILADEISPDTCRLWDIKSEKKLDKDRFRKDLGNIIQAYQEVARRLGIVPETTNVSEVNFKKPTSINIKKR